MATIRELAEYTSMSPSTVSIVLSGKASSRNISKATEEKILRAAKDLGYTPNISARRLRNNNTKKYVAVFWANDFRAPLLFSFINGMQEYIEQTQTDIEIVLRLFSPDSLHLTANPEYLSMYSAIVICTASQKDIYYLENTEFITPIVLYNRVSAKFSNVLVQNDLIGKKAAEIFLSHNAKKAIVLTSQTGHTAYSNERINGFVNTFNRSDRVVSIITAQENSYGSAYQTVQQSEELFRSADCVFCIHDLLAFGYLNYVRRTALTEIPKNQKLITIGVHDADVYENQDLPLSVIEIPIFEMGKECMRIVQDKLVYDMYHIESTVVDFHYVSRTSCPYEEP